MSHRTSLNNKNSYSVGWITALAIERAAATALLDQRHEEPTGFRQHESDSNSYTWGRIQSHNVVIASLASGEYGLTSATRTVQGLIASLPHIKIGLLVGIGAGVPECGLDIRLGDVAVSRPNGITSGVIQYDCGKAKSAGWERIGVLSRPPDVLLHALARLESEHELQGSQISETLQKAGASNPVFAEKYKHPGLENDQILQKDTRSTKRRRIDDEARLDKNPQIHYGTIGSGNTLIKDVKTRKDIINSIGPCICLEMEAAGLMNSFPCLVIRGISDYADASKNDIWQRYASATAAAFAKELLLHVPKVDIERSQRIEEAFEQVQHSVNQMTANLRQSQQEEIKNEASAFIRALYEKTCPYEERKDRNPRRVPGTCEWFTHHPLYTKWRDGGPSLLWVSADPGCGKSVLARFLVDELSNDTNKIVCYFFFKDDFTDQKTALSASCALLRQLLIGASQDVCHKILKSYENTGSRYFGSFKNILNDIVRISNLSSEKEIICILDAMDECQESDQKNMISSICELYSPVSNTSRVNIKILVTSRPYSNIIDNFNVWETAGPIIHLSGDNDEEKEAISKEIDIVIEHRIRNFSTRRRLLTDETEFLLQKFVAIPQRTYLWAHLTLALVEETPGFTKGQVRKILTSLPHSVDDAYNKVLNRSTNKAKTKTILNLIVAADGPLTVEMMSYLLALDGTHEDYQELQEFVEAPARFKDTIRQLCGLFVVVVDSKVYLLHQTAREFLVGSVLSKDQQNEHAKDTGSLPLQWKSALDHYKSQSIIAERCLRYLKLCDRDRGSEVLFFYCAANWVKHLRDSGITANESVIDLALQSCELFEYITFWYCLEAFLKEPTSSWSFPCYYRSPDTSPFFNDNIGCKGGKINKISLMGIPRVLQKYIDKNTPYSWDCGELSKALWWAVISRSTQTAQILLQLGAKTNVVAVHDCVDDCNSPSCHLEFLESSDGHISFQPWSKCVHTISNAINNNDIPMVTLLTEWSDRKKFTPGLSQKLLHFAASSNCDRIVKVLFEHDGCPVTCDLNGSSPLVEFWNLLRYKVSRSNAFVIRIPSGQTLLHFVVEHGCLDCTRFVLCQMVNENVENTYSDVASYLVMASNQDEMIEGFLANASIERSDFELSDVWDWVLRSHLG